MSEHISKFAAFVIFSAMMALIGFNLGVTVTEEVDSECIEYDYKDLLILEDINKIKGGLYISQ